MTCVEGPNLVGSKGRHLRYYRVRPIYEIDCPDAQWVEVRECYATHRQAAKHFIQKKLQGRHRLVKATLGSFIQGQVVDWANIRHLVVDLEGDYRAIAALKYHVSEVYQVT